MKHGRPRVRNLSFPPEENEPELKRWLKSKILTDKFLSNPTKEDIIKFGNRLGIKANRVKDLMKPDRLISAHIADTYAVRLRLSPSQYLA